MRPVQPSSRILPFPNHTRSQNQSSARIEVGPLRRIELHQVEHDEVRALRARLLEMILDNEQARKASRLRVII